MKYMLLIYGAPDAGPQYGTPEFDANMANWFTYSDKLFASGKMISGDPLLPTETATTVRVRGGDRLTTDGPFAETKEVLGGYYLIDVDDLDEALEWAGQMPNIEYGSVEVRPVMEMPS
jgi:hypothetical protein